MHDDINQSEGAVDAWGPTQEFLRLALSQVLNSSIFAREEIVKVLSKYDFANLVV